MSGMMHTQRMPSSPFLLHILLFFLLSLPPPHPLPDSYVLQSPKSGLSLWKSNSRFMKSKGEKEYKDCLSLKLSGIEVIKHQTGHLDFIGFSYYMAWLEDLKGYRKYGSGRVEQTSWANLSLVPGPCFHLLWRDGVYWDGQGVTLLGKSLEPSWHPAANSAVMD